MADAPKAKAVDAKGLATELSARARLAADLMPAVTAKHFDMIETADGRSFIAQRAVYLADALIEALNNAE